MSLFLNLKKQGRYLLDIICPLTPLVATLKLKPYKTLSKGKTMSKRRPMSRKSSNETFRKGTGVHRKNIDPAPQRGGYRL